MKIVRNHRRGAALAESRARGANDWPGAHDGSLSRRTRGAVPRRSSRLRSDGREPVRQPTQFADATDLTTYPRDEERDAIIAAESGIDLLFAPTVEEIFPEGYSSWITVEGPALGLEGDFRPGHFRGVATSAPSSSRSSPLRSPIFGQKDAQQVAVVRRMARDLNLPLEIRVVPTVRDEDGLALSSRNARLSPDDRRRALAISRALSAGLAAFRSGGDAVLAARAALGGIEPDYVAVADFDGQPTLAIAARIGDVRLIDNVPLAKDNDHSA
jgi:pantoate--beta-alanine ligase